MKLIVGLGNPGEKYEGTRHNVGFMALDALVSRMDCEPLTVDRKFNSLLQMVNGKLILAKPQTFMNSSGEAVQKLVNLYKIKGPNLWIIHDDLDIKLGTYKIQTKGPKVHNGLLSIYEKTGIKDFWHVRIGVDNRSPEERALISGEQYVLQKFTNEERQVLDGVIKKVVEELVTKLQI